VKRTTVAIGTYAGGDTANSGQSSSVQAGSAPAIACDLDGDGVVTAADVDLMTSMTLGLSACTVDIDGTGQCNAIALQRIINAALGGPCATGAEVIPHSVTLNWQASTSPNVIGYKIYRGTTSGEPNKNLDSSLVVGTTYTDTNVQAGQTYFYVVTAVDDKNTESACSNEAEATVPAP
jgi:hypothetical protein